MRFEDVPIYFVWEDRGIPTAVACDSGTLVTGLQAALPFLPRPTLAEGTRIFGRLFEMSLKMAMNNEANGHR